MATNGLAFEFVVLNTFFGMILNINPALIGSIGNKTVITLGEKFVFAQLKKETKCF